MLFSIIIPAYNESENLPILLDEIMASLQKTYRFEIIIVNDGSTDNTNINISNILHKYPLTLIDNSENKGQSFSISKGIKCANTDIIVTLDADLQNNPSNISKLMELYIENKDVKLIGGIRKNRKDSIIKIFSSKLANFIRKKILNDDCDDTGCSLKVFDKKTFLTFPYFNGIHRFLPALFRGFGSKTLYLDVDHRSRVRGVSKYRIFDRLYKGIIDIIRVKKIIKNNITKQQKYL